LTIINRGAEKTEAATVSLFATMGFAEPRPMASTVRIPGSFLGGLALAVRAHRWEAGGSFVHQELGLPAAADLLGELMRLAAEPSWDGLDRFVRSLFPGFIDVAHRFAAQGQHLLGAEVALGEPDDEALVEALARLCWAFREGGTSDEKAE
jgi:hypothetical protein